MTHEHPRKRGTSPLTQWFHQTVTLEQGRVRFRLRGNILHILCEGSPVPDLTQVLTQLLPALKRTDPNTLVPVNQPHIYQLIVYGRRPGQQRPDWSVPIDLSQLERHLDLLRQSHQGLTDLAAARVLVSPGAGTRGSGDGPPLAGAHYAPVKPPRNSYESAAAIQLSNLSQAKQGNTDAIARYLSETLSALGVAVQVSAKAMPYRVTTTAAVVAPHAPQPTQGLRRLWIVCDATYSPDPALVSEPIAQRLRTLELEGFRDAIILIQVRGEAQPDWLLRVDLTPPGEMLREWARWGDVPALSRLMDQALQPVGATLTTATLHDATLHLSCLPWAGDAAETAAIAPDQAIVRETLVPLLDTLAPQGIHSATVYGQVPGLEDPGWVMWLDLPATDHEELAETPFALAQRGDWGAIAYLLNRLLNPDIGRQLSTGGIRLQLLPKPDAMAAHSPDTAPTDIPASLYLLHIMADAPICPPLAQVSAPVVRFIQDLRLSHLSGVRLYGRRAGQKRPLWTDGIDFVSRYRRGSDITPEFAATDAYVGDLLAPGGTLVLHSELAAGIADLEIEEEKAIALRDWAGYLSQRLRTGLAQSQLFVPDEVLANAALTRPEAEAVSDGIVVEAPARPWRLALIWSVVGLLLALQIDWGLGRAVTQAEQQDEAPVQSEGAIAPDAAEAPAEDETSEAAQSTPTSTPTVDAVPPAPSPPSPSPQPTASPLDELGDVSLNRSPDDGTDVFDPSGFTDQGAGPASAEATDASPRPIDSPLTPSTAVPEAAPGGTRAPVGAAERLPTQAPAASAPATPAASALPYTQQDPRLQQIATEILANEPPLPTFNTRLLDEKYMLYRERVEQYGAPDVLIMGSSRALRGVDPIALRQELATLGYTDVTVFNYGINGATAQVTDLLLRQFIRPDELPKIIIWADGARALNSNSVDVTYNGVQVSEGYRALTALNQAAGQSPEVAATPPSATPGGIGESLYESYQAIDRQLSDRLGQVSAIYGQRDRLRSWVQALFRNVAAAAPAPLAGRSVPPSVQSLSEQGRDMIDFDGFLPLSVRFNPATYYQEFARVEGRYDGDYTDFRIEGIQADAMDSLLQFTGDRQIPVIFVNLPLTDEYLDPVRLAHEQQFRQYMLRQARAHSSFIFRDLSEGWLTEYNYFSDPSHLNRYGAYETSRRMAQDPLVPWEESVQQPSN